MFAISQTISMSFGMFLLNFIFTVKSQTGLTVDIAPKRFYIKTAQKTNWYEANFACAAAGLLLAAIESDREYVGLQNYLIKENLLDHEFWLSGSSLDGRGNTEFTWMAYGVPLTYTQWQSGQPDAAVSNACIFTNSQFKWEAAACDNLDKKYYICARLLTPYCGITGHCKKVTPNPFVDW